MATTKKLNKKLSFILLAVFLLAGFFLINHSTTEIKPEVRNENIKYVKIGDAEVKVDLALTPAEQEQGLSGRPTLAPDQGMLFIFNHPDKYAFWMKDMNFPIDIIWLDENLKVIYIKENARPELYPETYGPNADSKYVLEVVSGFAEKNNLKIVDPVEFVY